MRATPYASVAVWSVIVVIVVLGAHWLGYIRGSADQKAADQDSPLAVQSLIDALPLGSSHDLVVGFLIGVRAKPTDNGGEIFAAFPPYGGSLVCNPSSVVARFTFRTDKRMRQQVLATKQIVPEKYGPSCS